MANIATELNTIATATYGSDMREALHDSIKKVNEDPIGKTMGCPAMYTNDFIKIDTEQKTVSIVDGNDPEENIVIIVGNVVKSTNRQTVNYDISEGYSNYIFIDATDLTLKVDTGLPSNSLDLILIGVITPNEQVLIVPGFNLMLNEHKCVNNPLPIDVQKENAFTSPVFYNYRSNSLFVELKDDNSLNVRVTGGGFAMIQGLMSATSNNVNIPYIENEDKWYYLLYDVTNKKLDISTAYYDLNDDVWIGHHLIGAIFMPGTLEEDGTPNFRISVMPGMEIYPNGNSWIERSPIVYVNDANGEGGIGIDYYKQKLIIGDSSTFNLCSNIGYMPLGKGKTIDISATNLLYFDYFKKELLVTGTSGSDRPAGKDRYQIAGAIHSSRRDIAKSFGGSITRDGNAYFIFGDSIQTNVGVKAESGITIYGSVGFQVASSLNVEAANFAVSGMGFVRAIDGKTFYDKLVEAGSTYSKETRVPIAASLVGGTNDYGTSQLFGDLDTPNSFVYEVDRCFKYIHDNFYQIPFLICTPLHRSKETANSYGKTLSEYCDVIKERAQYYHLLFYDLYNDPNYDFRGEDNLMPDGLHPNYFGHRRLAPLFKSLLICG